MAFNADDIIKQLYPGLTTISLNGEDQAFDPTGYYNDMKAAPIREWGTVLSNFRNPDRQFLSMSDERIAEIMGAMAQDANQYRFGNEFASAGGITPSNVSKYLTPQEMQQVAAGLDWINQENADMSFGDYLARGAFGLGAGAIGAAALGMGPLAAASGTTGQGIFGAAAPTFTGGASGAGIAGAAGGGGTLSGLTAAEMAAIGGGAGGLAGSASGLSGLGSEFAGGASGGGISGGGGMTGSEFLGGATGGELAGGSTGGALSGAGGAGIGTAAQGAGSALGRILGGNASTDDWLSFLGGAGSTLLGLAGSRAQGDAYGDVAQQYLNMGAPYRNLLQQSYQPGFSMADQPDFQNAMDVGAQAAARATSARAGNPVDNPGAYAEMQKYITGSLALPQLNTYRSQLGSFGQLGTNTAGTASMGQASQTGGMYDALGYGLGQLTRPQNQNQNLLSNMLLNTGFSF